MCTWMLYPTALPRFGLRAMQTRAYGLLTEEEWLNTRCHHRAKTLLHRLIASSREVLPTIWGEPAAVFVSGQKVCKDLRKAVTVGTSGTQCRRYWQRKLPPDCAPVDWQSLGVAACRFPCHRLQFAVKHASGRTANGVEDGAMERTYVCRLSKVP